MKRYEFRERLQLVRELVATSCNGCGTVETPGDFFHQVVLSVGEGEEGGRRDELDLCAGCLVARAPALAAAGSRAPLVTGEYLSPDEDDEEFSHEG